MIHLFDGYGIPVVLIHLGFLRMGGGTKWVYLFV